MSPVEKLLTLLSRSEIDGAVSRLASAITGDYRDQNPLLIGVLKGSFMFLSDLVRKLDFPLGIDFVRLASYGQGQQTSGKVRMMHDFTVPISDRHVLVVEDIIDTGITTSFLMDYLRQKKPSSLKLCALLDKPSRRRVPVTIDYTGFTVPDKFLVGYGMDCDEKFRNLPDISCLESE
jgi:hypoxanthine phosphoribosyltransferase